MEFARVDWYKRVDAVLTDYSARLGIDVGGTFTDFVLADPGSNQLITHKEPSTPDDPSLAV
ncbi:MAG: hydantoinase/oxoprolinase N-terminal domain-containing protein, partial [Pseudomonadota bacterium]|nr:hydantoinase/oxoprolinase N-terminal domain-containing protein [Pseudomonadota bacterium]